MKATGTFVILLSQDGFENDCSEIKFQTVTSYSQFEKVTVQKSIAELWTVISNRMIKNQLPHRRFGQISNHKHGTYLSDCNRNRTHYHLVR